jgi:hypothetical protein
MNLKKENLEKIMGKGFLGMPIAIQRFIGKIFITIFFAYIALSVYPSNNIFAGLILLFGLFLAWGRA